MAFMPHVHHNDVSGPSGYAASSAEPCVHIHIIGHFQPQPNISHGQHHLSFSASRRRQAHMSGPGNTDGLVPSQYWNFIIVPWPPKTTEAAASIMDDRVA